MTRLPEIKIMANGDDEFTTAHIGKKLAVVRWRALDLFWVVAPGSAPASFDNEGAAVKAFMDLAMEATR